MKTSVIEQRVPYFEDVSCVFDSFAHMPWSVFLDSGRPLSDHGRYEIFSALPRKTFVTKGRKTVIQSGGYQEIVFDDPFALLMRELKNRDLRPSSLPFTGGAIGYFSYDLGRRVERIPEKALDDMNIPDMAIGIYHWAYVADHHNRTATLVGDLSEPRVKLNWEEFILKVSQPEESRPNSGVGQYDYYASSKIESNMSRHDYYEKFNRVKKYIGNGDCYQVNLAQRFTLEVKGPRVTGVDLIINEQPCPAGHQVPGLFIKMAVIWNACSLEHL